MPKMPPDILARSQAKQQDEMLIQYHSARVDFSLKLLESDLIEKHEIVNVGYAILPKVRVEKITPEESAKLKEKFQEEKKMILEKLGLKIS